MNQDLAALFLKQALQNAMKEGGNKLFEELSEALDPVQLDYLIRTLTKVRNRKLNVVNG